MTKTKARELRSVMTDAERRLWSALRDRRLSGYKFRRPRFWNNDILANPSGVAEAILSELNAASSAT